MSDKVKGNPDRKSQEWEENPWLVIGKYIFAFFASWGLASVVLTLLCLLTFIGTLEMRELGLYTTTSTYFSSWFVMQEIGQMRIPIPGGMLLMILLFINLLCGAIIKARKKWRTPGMLIAHGGILFMLLAGLVDYLATESGSLILRERADLGVRFEEVERGALVVGVGGNLVGKEAGIQQGDVLLGVTFAGEDGVLDPEDTRFSDDFYQAVDEFRTGLWDRAAVQLTTGMVEEERRLKILRKGEEIFVEVKFSGEAGNEPFSLIDWSIEVGEYTDKEFDLQLTSAENLEDLVADGKSLVVVATIGSDLHLRAFDADGRMIINRGGEQLVAGAELDSLKEVVQKQSATEQPEELMQLEEDDIIDLAFSLAGESRVSLPASVFVIPPKRLDPLEKTGARRVFHSEKLPFEIEVSGYLRNCNPVPVTIGPDDRKIGAGLTITSAKVYEGTWEKLPDFSTLEPVSESVPRVIDVDIARSVRNRVGIVYEGKLEVPGDGRYDFRLGSDDGSRLTIGGEEVIEIDGLHNFFFKKKAKDLKQGSLDFKLEYFGGRHQRELALSWSGPKFGDSPLSTGHYKLDEIEVDRQEEKNIHGAYVKILPTGGGEPIAEGPLYGDYPGFGLTAPMTFDTGGKRWAINLTKQRISLPFKIRLEDFEKIDHPGTTKPKEFKSSVTKLNPDGSPETSLIEMNKPLRAEGYTVYQASWGASQGTDGEEVLHTSLAVSSNPADQWPKISCYIVAIGLLVHFCQKLFKYLIRTQRKRKRELADTPKA